jgi:hypothetical protein
MVLMVSSMESAWALLLSSAADPEKEVVEMCGCALGVAAREMDIESSTRGVNPLVRAVILEEEVKDELADWGVEESLRALNGRGV